MCLRCGPPTQCEPASRSRPFSPAGTVLAAGTGGNRGNGFIEKEKEVVQVSDNDVFIISFAFILFIQIMQMYCLSHVKTH